LVTSVGTFDAEIFIQILVEFFEETGRTEHHPARAGAGGDLRVADVEFFLARVTAT